LADIGEIANVKLGKFEPNDPFGANNRSLIGQ